MVNRTSAIEDALAYIELIQTAQSTSIIDRHLHRFLERFGFRRVTIGTIPNVNQSAADSVLLNSRPQEYVETYLRDNHLAHDPVINALWANPLPYSWDEIQYQARFRTERSDEVTGVGIDFGMRDGLMVPVHGMGGKLGYFSIAGFEANTSAEAKSALTIAGMFTYQALARLDDQQHHPTVQLSPRERDVLSWATDGLSDGEIAEKLNLSENTVDYYMRNARRKLNVHNRTAAVVQAIKQGQIHI